MLIDSHRCSKKQGVIVRPKSPATGKEQYAWPSLGNRRKILLQVLGVWDAVEP